ncbi:MAG: hypothetical protein PSV35_00140 [bacterium]|nr:hypothetical protein [bacterium]
MPLTTQMLKNKSIYKEKSGTLAERIDFAWSIYTLNNKIKLPELNKIKKEALLFLTYALDIRDPQDVNGQLINLMAEREKVKAVNPGYIPGKSPNRLPFNPAEIIPSATPMNKKNESPQIAEAIRNNELLDVNSGSKQLDTEKKTIFLTEQERAERRVIISNGQFKKNGINFDTSNMHSHKKEGFAAFTLNANGELSVFVHNQMRDRFAHSSMNAGVPVVAAGEIKIENGVLKGITTHSGHYRPSLFNVYRLLEHFNAQGIDTSQAIVISFTNPAHSLKDLESRAVYYPAYESYMYETPANQIYSKMIDVINNSVSSINDQIKTYKEGGFLTAIYKFKDKIMRSNLTEERNKMAVSFEKEISTFKQGIRSDLPKEELKAKKDELNDIIQKYEKANDLLSEQHNKNTSSGRLSSTFSTFKDKLQEIKAPKDLDAEAESSIRMKKIS